MVKKLKWYDDRFRNTYRLKRRMLTLEEANERIHKYFPNLTILKYYGSNRPAEVYCENCESIFNTSDDISSYLYGYKTVCENCKEIKRTVLAKNKLGEVNLEYIGYHENLNSSGTIHRHIEYKCLKCGYISSISEMGLKHQGLEGCKNCKHLAIINKYKTILEKNNCTFLSTKPRINLLTLDVLFKYNECGHEHTLFTSTLLKLGVPKCPKCRGMERSEILHTFYKDRGLKYIRSLGSGREECFHLLCGHNIKKMYNILKSYGFKSDLRCKHCYAKITIGRSKEHNKHVVEEYYSILEYTLYLKEELDRNRKDISEISNHENYEFICDTLEYIEGWFVNFKSIKEKYPNGDLGTVLENNPYYLYVWNIVVPALEELLDINN